MKVNALPGSLMKELPVIIDEFTGGTLSDRLSVSPALEAVGDLISAILPVFRLAGVVLTVAGLARIVLAFRDDSPETKIEAVSGFVAGICLVCIRTFLSGYLSALGIRGVL